jgi:hypothetical protein
MSDMSQEENNPRSAGADQQADDRLVHSLLLHMHDDLTVEHRERRVQRALQAIRESVMRQSPKVLSPVPAHPRRTLRFPVWARRSAWAAAAVVLVAAGVWVFTYSSAPALASLNDIIGALGRPGDRTYRIHMANLPAPPERNDPEDHTPETIPRPGLDNATLYLRDGHQYLLVRNDPKGGLVFDGYDGQQSWRVRDGVLAETQEGLGAGGIPMPPMMADVPFSDLHGTLERIRVDYTVERLDQAALPSGGKAQRHVRVRRNSHEVKGPETIEIWADPKTAMPTRIVFDDAKIQGNRQPCRLTFDLVSQEPLPTDWFGPTSHVGGTTGNRHTR